MSAGLDSSHARYPHPALVPRSRALRLQPFPGGIAVRVTRRSVR